MEDFRLCALGEAATELLHYFDELMHIYIHEKLTDHIEANSNNQLVSCEILVLEETYEHSRREDTVSNRA